MSVENFNKEIADIDVHTDHHVDHKELLNQEWEKSQENVLIKGLQSGRELQEIMESLPGFKESFDNALDTIDCSDGRVLLGHKIGIAGSGILLSDVERQNFINANKGKIKIVTSHDDCGAAKIKFNSLTDGHLPLGVHTPDELGRSRAEEFARELGAQHMYLDVEKMANEVHNERALVLDQTGHFDSTNLKNFPAHFVSSGAGFGFSPEYMKAEIETLTGIALGDHGFGDRFTAENPFYVILSANSEQELGFWSEVAHGAISKFGERVVIDGFIRPTQD